MATVRGIAYPLTLEDGGLKVVSDADLIRSHVYAVLETYRMERILHPTFGLPQLIFQSVSNPSIITERIRRALATQIPDASFSLKTTIDDTGTMNIRVDWKIRQITQPPIQYRLTP